MKILKTSQAAKTAVFYDKVVAIHDLHTALKGKTWARG